MKGFATVIWLLGSMNLMAETISSRVHSYDQDYGFIRLETGRVVFIKKSEKSFSKTMEWLSGSDVKLEVDENNNLVNLSLEESQGEANGGAKSLLQDPPPFTPTVVSGFGAVQAMFERLNSNFKRLSECTDRAHVWAYDEFKSNNIATEKVFAFFTASYINRNKFKWWFHVAPLVSANVDGTVQKYVLDYRYKDRPATIKEWTDMMVYSHRECKMTTKFSEYDVNPQTEDCYMMIDSMYNRLPADLRAHENVPPLYRDRWFDQEVNASRSMAFEKKEN
jgi:hypothetical protein